MAASLPGLDPDRLQRRIEFLKSRAQAHLEAHEEMLHRACAATLLRDAACVALLIAQVTNARALLRKAGHQFLSLGLTYGASLIALARPETAREEILEYGDVIQGVRHQWSRAEAREGARRTRPMSDTARGSPRQMISLMQAELLMREPFVSEPPSEEEELLAALERSSGHPVGTTGLSVGTYLKIAQWMTERSGLEPPRLRDAAIPQFVGQGFTTIAATRAENIQAAMRDSYHWRLLARPAELLDLDTVALALLALNSGINSDWLQDRFFGEGNVVAAPLIAARNLWDDGDFAPIEQL